MGVFDTLSSAWWDPNGPMKVLHHINSLRVDWIRSFGSLHGKKILDVGCGGGILAESLARLGADVVGIDESPSLINVANLHASSESISVDYRNIDVANFCDTHEHQFDCVMCLEVIEHVSSPREFLGHCIKLLKEGGYLFLSTINRTARSYFLTILMAEYILGLIPRGVHNWSFFIKPSLLSKWIEEYGLLVSDIRGMSYNPLTRSACFASSVDVNYFMVAQK
ncbi:MULTISPECIES: bifunctional 2-polyprenyl-6-hydroxyphenol methylase/3-demethylubiquinol 3-O-methyltransferase UbiG [Candidatus Ichthyocystis]|uniref:bifunctional 2-polyprenyl-6-hydroxyphenol methylase/3-demethylubiquinol 3-O-methyltransferase UbiG n=1 Tax=Candidatus Ichthyocystis TaxID=2929841 RepID=UPI000A8FFC21|nr:MULTISPECIES: bifunctional 2-polyprenyl-6-hydroxyphenol methylase/3-demethylubiquinol 3-O-methyltransferase UbiG [Ichthyocystis]